jgi:hypothetical protein
MVSRHCGVEPQAPPLCLSHTGFGSARYRCALVCLVLHDICASTLFNHATHSSAKPRAATVYIQRDENSEVTPNIMCAVERRFAEERAAAAEAAKIELTLAMAAMDNSRLEERGGGGALGSNGGGGDGEVVPSSDTRSRSRLLAAAGGGGGLPGDMQALVEELHNKVHKAWMRRMDQPGHLSSPIALQHTPSRPMNVILSHNLRASCFSSTCPLVLYTTQE